MCWCSFGYPDPVCFVRVIAMALYRIKPGFDPETAFPSWNSAGMDYLLDAVFEGQEDRCSNKNYVMTIDADGKAWYLSQDWVVPAVVDLDLTVVGDEI